MRVKGATSLATFLAGRSSFFEHFVPLPWTHGKFFSPSEEADQTVMSITTFEKKASPDSFVSFFFFFFFFILLPRSTNVQTLCITVHSDRMDSSIFLSFKTIVSRNRTSFFTHIWPSVFLCVVHNYWYR